MTFLNGARLSLCQSTTAGLRFFSFQTGEEATTSTFKRSSWGQINVIEIQSGKKWKFSYYFASCRANRRKHWPDQRQLGLEKSMKHFLCRIGLWEGRRGWETGRGGGQGVHWGKGGFL